MRRPACHSLANPRPTHTARAAPAASSHIRTWVPKYPTASALAVVYTDIRNDTATTHNATTGTRFLLIRRPMMMVAASNNGQTM